MKFGGSLTKREHQIMDLAYQRGSVTSPELEQLLEGRPTNSAVRVFLRGLEAKGLLLHKEVNGKFTYFPVKERLSVAKAEASRLLDTFCGGSITAAVATLLDQNADKLTEADVKELRELIEKVAKEGR